ncbi:efflux RND transporter periplasmic adaptor subunit [Seonamhaeicola sp.]|uniref:efflux RND transporter periplasmic adaptor subunit n=1 Tax=Seonamhaeicola sp. TaxID=1912245 RepID=UPI002634CD8B|nr:efflux RND transporter periplasmic adaptor subunit [Seonamhaeicola sp.]
MKTIKRLLLLTISSFLLASCYWTETEQKPVKEAQIHVKAITLKKEHHKETKDFYGELQFSKATSFVAQQSGIITKLNAQPGQKVRRGEIIAVYPPINHQLQIDQLRIEHEKAIRDYERQQELLKAGAVSKVSVEAYKAQKDIQAKTMEQLQNMNVIRAPFSGIITQVPVKIGEEVRMGQALFSMAKTDAVAVNFYVTQQDISQVEIGTVTYLSLADKRVEGHIAKRAIQMDPTRKAFQVTALFHNREVPFVGTHAEIQLETGEALSSIRIPIESLKQSGNRNYVFVIEDGKAIEKDVKIGQRNEVSAQVIEGLSAGQQLITAGVEKVEHNSLVLIVNK